MILFFWTLQLICERNRYNASVECIADTGVTADADVKCTPIIGAMTFFSDCPTCPYPEGDILASIEEAMKSGAFADNVFVKQVNYVPSKESQVMPSIETPPSSKSLVVGIIIAVIAIQVFFTLYVIKRRKIRRSARYADETWLEDDYGFDPETVPIDLTAILEVEEEEEGINVSFLQNGSISKFTRQFSFKK